MTELLAPTALHEAIPVGKLGRAFKAEERLGEWAAREGRADDIGQYARLKDELRAQEAADNFLRQSIVGRVGEVVEPHLDALERLDPDALVGFRGSLARGFKSEQKNSLPFDVNNFDVDAFIVSDRLAAHYPRDMQFRDGGRITEIEKAQESIDQALRRSPGFSGLRDEPFTFRIYTQREIQRMQAAQDAQYFFLRKR